MPPPETVSGAISIPGTKQQSVEAMYAVCQNSPQLLQFFVGTSDRCAVFLDGGRGSVSEGGGDHRNLAGQPL